MPIDIDYDEALGNPKSPECLLSLATSEDWYESTKDALPYEDPADDDEERQVVAIAWVERLFRRARVEQPRSLRAVPFFTSCLGLEEYLKPAMTYMMENGFLQEEDDDEGGGGPQDLPDLRGAASSSGCFCRNAQGRPGTCGD